MLGVTKLTEAQIQRTLSEDFGVVSDLLESYGQDRRWPVHPNSSLALDDEATAGFDPISSQFEGLMHAAMDNLHGVKSMIVDASAIHTFAEYAMIRAGIEASVQGWWLLAPSDRKDRCTRSLRLFWKDACDGAAALEGSGAITDYKERRLTHLQSMAARLDIPFKAATTAPTSTAMLKEFGARHDLPSLLVWRAASGMVHGRRWSTLALSDLEHNSPPEAAMLNVKVSGNLGQLAVCYHVACLTLQEAMRQFHLQRALPPCRSRAALGR